MDAAEAEVQALREAVGRLEARLGRWPKEPQGRVQDEPSPHAALVAELLLRPWPRCRGAPSDAHGIRSPASEGSRGGSTSSCSRALANEGPCHAGSRASSLPVQVDSPPPVQEEQLFYSLGAAPKVQAAAAAPPEDEAETDCSSGGGDHGNMLSEERSAVDQPDSACARQEECVHVAELAAQRDEALRQLQVCRRDFNSEVKELRAALVAKDAALQAAHTARRELEAQAREASDARQLLSAQLRSEQLAMSRCREELAQARAAHQQEWLLGKQLNQDLQGSRATAEALRADLRDAGERVAEQHAKSCDFRSALEKERRESHRLQQALEECKQELQLYQRPMDPPSDPQEPAARADSRSPTGTQVAPAILQEMRPVPPPAETAPSTPAASPKVSAMARLLGQGGPDQESSDTDFARKVSFLEGQLRRYSAERDSLETALRKLPANSTGKSVAERRRIGEMEQRLAEVERTITELKTGVRRLRRADG